MKIIDLSGKTHKLDIRQSQFPIRSELGSKSKFQFNCGQIIKKYFPNDIILEECYIACEKVYLDFFIPFKKIVFEIHGPQHDKFVPFFHTDKQTFAKAQSRDSKKQAFCEANNFTLIVVRSIQELEELLNDKK